MGEGLAKAEIKDFIEREGLTNVRLLDYQPLDRLRYSLSAADVHLVSMGGNMVGIVHPCKVYGAMAVGRPILLLGPRRSHIGGILDGHEIGWQVDHEDVEGAAAALRAMIRTDRQSLTTMGERARRAIGTSYSKGALCGAFCDVLEHHLMGQ